MSQFNQQFITSIIDRYRLELEEDCLDSIVATWIGQYDRTWIIKAIVESLHRGRYKIKSVDSILSGWQRTGKPSYNFPPEFEREILQDLPVLSDLAETQAPSTLLQLDDLDLAIQFPALTSDQLNPEESAPFPHHDRAIPLPQPPTAEHSTTFSRTEILGIRDSGAFAPAIDSVYASGRLTPKVEDSVQDHRPSSSTSLSLTNFKSEGDVKPNHIIPHPKFQLFHTLRAIITPSNVQVAELDELHPPSYSTDLA